MTAAWLLLSLLAALGFYLACAHQKLWPRRGGRVRALRMAAGACALLALLAAIAALGVWAGVFAALTAFMLAAVLLPYFDAWRQARAAAHEEPRHVG
ncbi:hypothetical protein B1992_07380 [Pseudoxanthomonas broegbernensis]|uniref:DUF3325 domain-containing protein n=1 Tax=Pseudoxanthomonas broegbernensis TaxID=83619 RepID=A0A7V8K7P2_9GAMM|nr:hypothetical protein [Pseudoxanthomonas broegbernensis]KAF1686717.1 hypothetical protein B1992_07380 [Pseudoxanthomonas broegbernensis]MBB6063518.1 O-antigen/teichoic acid export membrane protein [Pseudoxanthomonas broegbernensis]